LGSGVWSRDANRCYRFGRENHNEKHKMMLDHYQQAKTMLVSYSTKTRLLLSRQLQGIIEPWPKIHLASPQPPRLST
jgi:hypothetical protein